MENKVELFEVKLYAFQYEIPYFQWRIKLCNLSMNYQVHFEDEQIRNIDRLSWHVPYTFDFLLRLRSELKWDDGRPDDLKTWSVEASKC